MLHAQRYYAWFLPAMMTLKHLWELLPNFCLCRFVCLQNRRSLKPRYQRTFDFKTCIYLWRSLTLRSIIRTVKRFYRLWVRHKDPAPCRCTSAVYGRKLRNLRPSFKHRWMHDGIFCCRVAKSIGDPSARWGTMDYVVKRCVHLSGLINRDPKIRLAAGDRSISGNKSRRSARHPNLPLSSIRRTMIESQPRHTGQFVTFMG
jgi:hypothetical protein